MASREHPKLIAVADETIVIDELVGRPLGHIVDHPELPAVLADVVPDGEQTLRSATAGGTGVVLQLSAIGAATQVLVVARPAHSTARAAMSDAVTGLASLDLFRASASHRRCPTTNPST